MMITIQMEISHANFSKVTGMVFVKVDAMMMHTTGITATTRMLAMLACGKRIRKMFEVISLVAIYFVRNHKSTLTNTTMTVTDMST